eukprot:gene57901-biopygen29285
MNGNEFRLPPCPLRVAYAGTLHKAQGKTLDRALLVLTHDCFAHGQLYVGLTRVAGAADIAVLLPPAADDDDAASTDHATQPAVARGVINVVSRSLVADIVREDRSNATASAPPPPSTASAAIKSLSGQRLPPAGTGNFQ